MKPFIEINYYPHFDYSNNLFCVEVEYINNLTGATAWKTYHGKTEKTAKTIAKRETTKIKNRIARLYN